MSHRQRRQLPVEAVDFQHFLESFYSPEWSRVTPGRVTERLRQFTDEHVFDIGWPPIAKLVVEPRALHAAIRANLRNSARADALADKRYQDIMAALRTATAGFKSITALTNQSEQRRALRQFADAMEALCTHGLGLGDAHRPARHDWPAVERELPGARRLAHAFFALKRTHRSPIAAWDHFALGDDVPDAIRENWIDGDWPRTANVLAMRYLTALTGIPQETIERRLRTPKRQKS